MMSHKRVNPVNTTRNVYPWNMNAHIVKAAQIVTQLKNDKSSVDLQTKLVALGPSVEFFSTIRKCETWAEINTQLTTGMKTASERDKHDINNPLVFYYETQTAAVGQRSDAKGHKRLCSSHQLWQWQPSLLQHKHTRDDVCQRCYRRTDDTWNQWKRTMFMNETTCSVYLPLL